MIKNSAEKSFLIIAALNLFLEMRNFKIDFKKKRLLWTSKQEPIEKIMDMIRQFLFLFGQFVLLNILSIKGFRKSACLTGTLISYICSKFLDIKVPLLISAFIMTRIGFAFFDKAVRDGIIKNQYLIWTVLIIALLSFFNFLIAYDRSIIPKRILRNYLKIGRLGDLAQLEFDMIGERLRNKSK